MSGQNQTPRGWHPRGGPPSPIQYRPPSPWAPSPPPIISGPRGSVNSPAPGTSSVGMSPRSTPISPMFGSSGQRGHRIPCPRPRWPGPLPVQSVSPHQNMVSPSPIMGVNGPKPYVKPPFSPTPLNNDYARASPIICQTPPEYLYSAPAPYEPARYDFVGGPIEPPQPKSYIIYDDDEDQGPSTAEIIANQSQDYVDEKLAEYQMTIMQLQGEYKQLFSLSLEISINSAHLLKQFLKIYRSTLKVMASIIFINVMT